MDVDYCQVCGCDVCCCVFEVDPPNPVVDVPSDLDQSNPVDLTKQEWSDIYSDPDYEDLEP
jgi:hypothetical protein